MASTSSPPRASRYMRPLRAGWHSRTTTRRLTALAQRSYWNMRQMGCRSGPFTATSPTTFRPPDPGPDHRPGGKAVATFGVRHENGNWSLQRHFQIVTDHPGLKARMHGVGLGRDWQNWRAVSPAPSVIMGLPVKARPWSAAAPIGRWRSAARAAAGAVFVDSPCARAVEDCQRQGRFGAARACPSGKDARSLPDPSAPWPP